MKENDSPGFFDFLRKWRHRLHPNEESASAEDYATRTEHSTAVLAFLKILPWVCFFTYLISLKWEFSGEIDMQLFWRDDRLKFDGLLRMLSVCGLVGFGTNWIAIKMLFYPRKKRPLLGQGLIPSRKNTIAEKMGEAIHKEIINPDLILKNLSESDLLKKQRKIFISSLRVLVRDQEFQKDILLLTENYLNNLLKSKHLKEKIKELIHGIDFQNVEGFESGLLKLYRILKGERKLSKTIVKLLENITFNMDRYEDRMKEYIQEFPEFLENNAKAIEEGSLNIILFLLELIQIDRIIIENLRNFDEIQMENLLLRSTSDQLQYIQYLGSLLGILGGLFIWQPFESMVLLFLIGGGIWAADSLIGKINSYR